MAKQVADILTLSRFFLAGAVVLLTLLFGEQALPAVFGLLLVGWTTDSLDGPLARKVKGAPHTWIGDNDALADTALAVGTLLGFCFCGYISGWIIAIYLLIAGAVVVATRSQVLNMTSLALIHAFTLYGAFRYGWFWGALGVAWILIALVLNWRRFAYLVGFFLRGWAHLPQGEAAEAKESQEGSRAFLRN